MPDRTLQEAPICAAAVAKLRSGGWKVACEIEVFDFRDKADAVALCDDNLMIVEAKVSLNQSLRRQAYRRQLAADLVLAVVGTMPRMSGLEWCKREGIGLWVVTDEGVREVAECRQQNANAHYRKLMIERLNNADETVVGGVPHLKGIGVAQDCQRRVDEYRAEHPKATWKEIFANVPSHYATAPNMYSALRSNAERLAWRARQKQECATELKGEG
jgi:hypothetical protein